MAALQQLHDPTNYKPSDVSRVNASCMWERPYRKRREPSTYGFVRITSCKHDTWWYRDLIDLELFCELRWNTCPYTKKKYLREAVVVRLGKSQMEVGRNIAAEDVELL